MTPRRLVILCAAFAVSSAVPLAAAAAMIRAPASVATAPKSWAATASSDGMRVQVVVNDFLVVSNIVDVGGPSAQAVVDAFGDSRAYAAYPYPGDIVLTAHGLSMGAAPSYPLIAQSDPTQPRSDVSNGPYELHARSTDDTSAAVAQAAAGGGGVAAGTTQSSATASHNPDTDAVTAEAASTAEGVSIAGVLSIGRVHPHALMTAGVGVPVTRSSDTEVGDVTVGGQQVGFTDKGLVLYGTDVPLPPDSTANALLSAAGITVHYLAPLHTDTSTVAPGLSVSVQQTVPGVGPATVNYVFGQAVASAQATGAVPESAPTAQAGSTSSSGAPVPASAGAPGGPVSSPSLPSTGQPGTGSSVAPPVTAGTPATGSTAFSPAAATGPSSASFYLVIAAGAIVMVAAAQLFRILAVKLAWT